MDEAPQSQTSKVVLDGYLTCSAGKIDRNERPDPAPVAHKGRSVQLVAATSLIKSQITHLKTTDRASPNRKYRYTLTNQPTAVLPSVLQHHAVVDQHPR